MDDKILQGDIDVAEELDHQLYEESANIDDIQGSMEAVTSAIVTDEEPVQLTEHQQARVDQFTALQKEVKGAVYAVADNAALETYIDKDGIERNYKPLLGDHPPAQTMQGMRSDYGPNVWGTFQYGGLIIPGNESFMDMSVKLAKKAALAFSTTIPDSFQKTAKGLKHYIDMGQRLRARLVQLRPLLQKRDVPFDDTFEYGAYSRFFQVGGQALEGFADFQSAMTVQYAALMYTVSASSSYGIPVMQKMLDSLQALQTTKKPDEDTLIALRDSVELHWDYTWKQADIMEKPGQTPQFALNAFPERKFTCLAPLLDNRYLVAHAPKSNGLRDPERITINIKHYGASLVFDKKAVPNEQKSMIISSVSDLLDMVDQTITALNELKGLGVLASKNEGFAKDFKKATVILNNAMESATDKEFFGFISEYFKLVTAIGTTVQQPYIQMAWMYIRCAMVVTSMVELAVLEEPKQRIAYNRFGTKQNTEFSNPALESYNLTQKALAAAKRVK